MTHFVKTLGDKLVDVHSVGQNKVCAEKTGLIKKQMQAPKKIIQNKYIQHLTTAHWTCSTAAAVGLGHENGNNLYTFFRSASLFAFFEKFCLTMFMLIFPCLSFLHAWCLK